jgi:hypothetical protein
MVSSHPTNGSTDSHIHWNSLHQHRDSVREEVLKMANAEVRLKSMRVLGV